MERMGILLCYIFHCFDIKFLRFKYSSLYTSKTRSKHHNQRHNDTWSAIYVTQGAQLYSQTAWLRGHWKAREACFTSPSILLYVWYQPALVRVLNLMQNWPMSNSQAELPSVCTWVWRTLGSPEGQWEGCDPRGPPTQSQEAGVLVSQQDWCHMSTKKQDIG